MSKRSSIPYRPDIDGLRALAVTMVLVFHLNPALLRGGFIGVDVFFVISGFLIFSITRRELRDQTFSLLQFYGRRVRRLFPALILMLAAVTAVGWAVMSGPEFLVLGRHLVASVTYVSNFAYWREAGYFDTSSEMKPLLHLWSLAIEEQFYVFWPLLAAWLYSTRRNFARWTLALVGLSFVAGIIATSMNRTAGFYLSPVRFWEILVGCALALDLVPARPDQRRNLEAAAGLILIGLATFLFDGHQRYPGARALLPTLGAALLISAGPRAWFNRTVLGSRAAGWLGRISYPLYLWHWPVIVFLRLLAPRARDSGLGQVGAALMSLLLAQLTYSLLERPLHRLDPRGRAWGLMVPWVALGILGAFVWRFDGLPSRTPRLNAQLASVGERPPEYYHNEFCPDEIAHSGVLKFCRQARAGQPTHAVIGDSHANHVFEGVATAKDQNWIALGNAICAPILGLRVDTGGGNCTRGLYQMLDYLKYQPSIKTVVLSFYAQYASVTDVSAQHVQRHGGPSSFVVGEPGLNEEQRFTAFEGGLEAFFAALEDTDKQIILAYDVPELPVLPQDCIRRPWSWEEPASCVIPRAAVASRQARYRQMMASILKRHPHVRAYDPLNGLCDDSSCFAADAEGPLYFDSHHVGERGSRKAFAGLIKFVR